MRRARSFLDRIPDLFRDGTMAPGDPRTAPAVARFLTAFLDRVAEPGGRGQAANRHVRAARLARHQSLA